MELKKLIPWNWFKNEEEDAGRALPVKMKHMHNRGGALHSPMQQLHREIDRLFDQTFRGFGLPPFGFERSVEPAMVDGMIKPTLNLGATDSEYSITVEIPGVDEKDLSVEISNDTLTIRGEKKQELEEKDKNYYRMECSYGTFQRVLSLPEDADQESVKAVFKKGVLTVTLPRKALPKSTAKQIAVTSG